MKGIRDFFEVSILFKASDQLSWKECNVASHKFTLLAEMTTTFFSLALEVYMHREMSFLAKWVLKSLGFKYSKYMKTHVLSRDSEET